MTRLWDLVTMDWRALEKWAQEHGRKLTYRRARCEHGRTREQFCHDCEVGYVQDTSAYANLGTWDTFQGADLVAESDDGYDVAYVAQRKGA
jgi:hypothetical protein